MRVRRGRAPSAGVRETSHRPAARLVTFEDALRDKDRLERANARADGGLVGRDRLVRMVVIVVVAQDAGSNQCSNTSAARRSSVAPRYSGQISAARSRRDRAAVQAVLPGRSARLRVREALVHAFDRSGLALEIARRVRWWPGGCGQKRAPCLRGEAAAHRRSCSSSSPG